MSITAMALLDLISRIDNDPNRRIELSTGFNFFRAALQEGLVNEAQGMNVVADYVGRLVEDGYLTSGSHAAGTIPPPSIWGDRELQSHYNYRPTAQGRVAASDYRRNRIEEERLQLMGAALAPLDFAFLPTNERKTLERCRNDQLCAVQEERPSAVIGASKNLAEAACLVVIELLHTEQPTSKPKKLPGLIREACQLMADKRGRKQLDGTSAISRSLAAAIDGLADFRNTHGDGHGKVRLIAPTMHEAILAYDSSNTIVRYLLNGLRPDATA